MPQHWIDLTALWLTVRLAAVTTLILLVLGTLISAWIVFTRSRLRPIVEAVCALPLLLPPTVLGFYLLVLLGPQTAPGRLLTHIVGHPLAFTFWGLVIGSVIYSLPFAVQPLVAGFHAVDPALREQAALLGAGRIRILRELLLPLSKRSILTAITLVFAHTVGEFGVVLMIGGDIPGATRTLSIAIYDQVQDFSYTQANHTAILLLIVATLALIATYWRSPHRELTHV